MTRSTVRDGLRNRLEFYATTHFGPLWRGAQAVPPLARAVNRALIDHAIGKMPNRPAPLSTMAPYPTWESLTDRTFAGRHLPPVPVRNDDLPDVEEVADLFARRDGTVACPKSTVLFAYFAQWFTDGFLRTDRRTVPRDPRRTTSNHEIDLSQLYGPHAGVTRVLRSFRGGELRSQEIGGEEYPPTLCADGQIKPEFGGLEVAGFDRLPPERRDGLFAMGSDRANSQGGYAMLNVLFLREHNRIARLLAAEYPAWDDDRLYGTARNILTVLLLRIVIEEYINHITPYHFRAFLDPAAFGTEPWYRPNWMAIEFNLLYRWHSLIPSTLRIDAADLPVQTTLFDNTLLTRRGLGPLFEDASRQPAGRIGLFNTDHALRETELDSIQAGRDVELASYNDYRQLCGFPRVTDFDQISGDPAVQSALEKCYGSVDAIEYYVGLFAEDVRPNSAVPALLGRMVGADAFSQALTNPLLAPRLYHEGTFSPLGMDLIAGTRTLSDVLHRNVPGGEYLVTLTRTDWRRR
jgi:prostaglandin-endoperoxide synthase 2